MSFTSIRQYFTQLENDLQSALESDEKNRLENNAKMRAIAQKTTSYEEFRSIVKAAHLKPINKPNACESKQRTQFRTNENPNSVKLASHSSSFLIKWEKMDQSSRLTLLYNLGPLQLIGEVGNDFSTELLCEILNVLLQFQNNTQEFLLTTRLLQTLIRIERFAILVRFFDAAEREICQKLFQKLSTCFILLEKDLFKTGFEGRTLYELKKMFG